MTATDKRPSPPPALRGFERIKRIWDNSRQTFMARVLPGEYYVTHNDEAITTVLGSCIAVCVRDREIGVGGMNHFMLPLCKDEIAEHCDSNDQATRYGNYAMEHMINDVLKNGGRRGRLEFKVFGGGAVVEGMSNIGSHNITFVHDYIQMEGLRMISEDVGGNWPRKVIYFPQTGRALVKKMSPVIAKDVVQQEKSYMHDIETQPVEGSIDLF